MIPNSAIYQKEKKKKFKGWNLWGKIQRRNMKKEGKGDDLLKFRQKK